MKARPHVGLNIHTVLEHAPEKKCDNMKTLQASIRYFLLIALLIFNKKTNH